MMEVAFEAALKDEQDMDQMPEAQNKDTEAGKEDSYKAVVLKVWTQDQQQQQVCGDVVGNGMFQIPLAPGGGKPSHLPEVYKTSKWQIWNLP